jgi:hypothetical protein
MTTAVLGEPAAVPKEVREALTVLIEYLWDDERRNFEQNAMQDWNAHVSEHAFVALCWVRTWLEGRHYDPQQFIPPNE